MPNGSWPASRSSPGIRFEAVGTPPGPPSTIAAWRPLPHRPSSRRGCSWPGRQTSTTRTAPWRRCTSSSVGPSSSGRLTWRCSPSPTWGRCCKRSAHRIPNGGPRPKQALDRAFELAEDPFTKAEVLCARAVFRLRLFQLEDVETDLDEAEVLDASIGNPAGRGGEGEDQGEGADGRRHRSRRSEVRCGGRPLAFGPNRAGSTSSRACPQQPVPCCSTNSPVGWCSPAAASTRRSSP